MSRGGPERKAGRRRHTNQVAIYAGELVGLRSTLDGMSATDPAFEATLAHAEHVAVDLSGVSTRMDRDGSSRRSACERLLSLSTVRVEV